MEICSKAVAKTFPDVRGGEVVEIKGRSKIADGYYLVTQSPHMTLHSLDDGCVWSKNLLWGSLTPDQVSIVEGCFTVK